MCILVVYVFVKKVLNVLQLQNVENLMDLLGTEENLLSGVLKRLVKVQLLIIIV
jgi:hypothetical protein